ncbi:MAG: bifunctional DedA family/phosphatase PAP2 family protein [Candidatus Gracilibacteria bacterium]
MPSVDQIIAFVSPFVQAYGYIAVFTLSILEAMPLTGIVVPGEIIIVLGGFFAKTGDLNLIYVILAAGIGAIIGDFIGYILGYKFGENLLRKYGKYLFFKEAHFEKTKKLMHEHCGKSLFIGRFNKVTRAFVPFIAGSSKVPFLKFMIFNIIGGLSWAIVYVGVGFIFGKSWEVASKYLGRFILIAIALSAIIILAYRIINKHKHIFAKYHLHVLMINIAALYLLGKMIDDAAKGELMAKIDYWINIKITVLWHPYFIKFMMGITQIATPSTLITVSAALFLTLAYQQKIYHYFLLIFSIVGGVWIEMFMKGIVERPRPTNALFFVDNYSLPSGHATMAFIFFTMLLYSFKDDFKSALKKKLFITGCIFGFLLIGFSRIFLNVHWFSDVIAGFALGLFWITLLILIFKFVISTRKKTPQLQNPTDLNMIK